MEYSRPDFTRPSLNWSSLHGPWDFVFDDTDAGLQPPQSWAQSGLPFSSKQSIIVPYAFQTPASGINIQEAHEVLWYERTIVDIRSDDEITRGNRLLLRFGGVDYDCTVWVDGHVVGSHRGGQVGFDVDISDSFFSRDGRKKEARLTMRVRDSPTDLAQPRGKQYWGPVPESIFYTPTSGIWSDVWVESVSGMRICDSSGGTVLRGDDVANGVLHARVAVTGRRAGMASCRVEVEARLGGVSVWTTQATLAKDKEFVELDVPMRVLQQDHEKLENPLLKVPGCWHENGTALWAPEHPVLYDIFLRLFDGNRLCDEVGMTTGMRNLDWRSGDGTFRLNGKPLFQALVLDQGYWPQTGLTPPSHEALREDIVLSQAMGFNGCRKHQKVEHPVFLYWADRLGYLVWGEIGNAYEFNADYVERFNAEWMEAVRRDINHPCIVTWTPVNESWGYTALGKSVEQRNHIRSLYYMTKTLDPSRPINDNCGWEHVVTDLTTYHDYNDSAALAVMCSKMEGGILAKKSHGEMFPGPIYAGNTLLDRGCQHQPGAPVLCTEFGGVNIAPAKDTTAGERDWGYTTAADPNDLLERIQKLIMAVVQGGHSCGFVYTQLCDIEQEVNGVYSYDRRTKVPADKVKAIVDTAKAYYYEKLQ